MIGPTIASGVLLNLNILHENIADICNMTYFYRFTFHRSRLNFFNKCDPLTIIIYVALTSQAAG